MSKYLHYFAVLIVIQVLEVSYYSSNLQMFEVHVWMSEEVWMGV